MRSALRPLFNIGRVTSARTIMSFPANFPKPQLPESMNGLTSTPKLHLYTAGTPNGYKVSVLLEELVRAYPDLAKDKLSYDFYYLDINDRNDQKTPGFLEINPNGRIPALLDDNVQVDGHGHRVFETANILIWLVEQYDKENKFWFDDVVLRSEALNYIFWTQAGLGPMQGQANWWIRSAPEKTPLGIKRYQNETTRLYGVLETKLGQGKGEWLVGDKYSIVDMNAFGWVRRHSWAGIDITPFPKLSAWLDRIHAREGAWAGVGIPLRKAMQMDDKEAQKLKDRTAA